MTHNLNDLTEKLMSAALRAGADQADIVAVKGTSLNIDVQNGKLETAERSEGIDIGLRVLIDKKQACVSSSNVSDHTLNMLAERAVAMAKVSPEDPFIGLADTSQLARDTDNSRLDLFDPGPEPDPENLENAARQAEDAALSITNVQQVLGASASYSFRTVRLAASNGFNAEYQRSNHSISCGALAKSDQGMERDYDYDTRIYHSDLRHADDIGRSAGERAVAALNPRRIKTGNYNVIIDERVSASLINHLISAVNGMMIARGSSWARDMIGQQILPQTLTLTEDPHRPRVGASRFFDAEGLPTRRRNIVENGVLTGWTLDLATARKLGMDSTANASRGTSAPPSPSVGNLMLTQGDKSAAQLMKDMGSGLLVTSFIGATINPNTGDYSRGVSGFWIENGEPAYPVSEITIAGNLKDMLLRIIPANDARTYKSCVVPSLMIEGLTLAGD